MRFVSACALGAGLLALLASAGCAENESSMFVGGVIALEYPDCGAAADPGSTMLANGVLDVALSERYDAALLVGNQLVARGSTTQVRTETARVTLRGAEVRINTSRGESLDEYTVDGTGFVNPSSGTEPGYGVFYAMLVSPDVATGQRLQWGGDPLSIVANVKVFGTTLGGKEIESNELSFPIEICRGCLISFPPLQMASGTCVGDPTEVEVTPCHIGQDEIVDCRLCVGSDADCAAPP